ncbi:hypothetical protein DPMN_083793 [Dreissena polymorpha]|uniref:Uncharacterized protein n=1 Tax=Dreissena polymorpha TaxID=45954 RepID=A0A9D3YD92_DREPO|nr:hypothetical protein DPMN_083793 [Dreissena polymorpha]
MAPWRPCFFNTPEPFKLFQDMSKFHEDWGKTCLLDCSHKTAPLPGGHVFSLIMTIFKLVRDIHITNAKHVTSRVFTSLKKTPPPGRHVFFTDPNHSNSTCGLLRLRK